MKIKIVILSLLLIAVSCKNKKTEEEELPYVTTGNPPPPADLNNTLGFKMLKRICAIWSGPVTSTTPLGGYPEWIVDFRPISENQVSAKNELDTLNDIHMSFFVALYNNQYKVAFRNGGSFAGNKRVSYFLADSIYESGNYGFYRFSEVLKGRKRAFTDVIFKADSLYIKSYTNKYNTQTNSTPHMVWSAKMRDTSSAVPARNNFMFPKKTLTKDFTTTFNGQTEAIYFNTTTEPYPESAQPYLGQTSATYSFAAGYTPVPTKKVFLIITTQPLFNGMMFMPQNLKFRSRYVILAANDNSYTFNYMHPGTYYYYAFYDNDGNNMANPGDWISTTNTTFTLGNQSTVVTGTQINFTLP
ncbi:MAG: hypothetical protein K0S32_2324 [Bacteroidetes bacterium]|jgi:hypothetical protein|nr:hypothetical protein [Bacteroidota bacterium]